jgi:5-hydroxyisourate hydrolase
MSKITTHVLDAVLGKPAAGIAVKLERWEDQSWETIASAATDQDGRCADIAADATPGSYRLTFATGVYFSQHNRTSIHPEIVVTFQCGSDAHYHLPLLLSDNSYTTYRGS